MIAPTTTSTPYADAAPSYQRGGWSPIPLPAGRKKTPPVGWTGYGAPMASAPDVHDWSSNGHAAGNIALRTPETVVGLDLDAYDGKPGLSTMLDALDRLGPLPPTYGSTSRADDPVSGIRFYRVPAGRRWADALGPAVEVIHHGHRYAVAAPSVHPEGRPYGWRGPDGQPVTEPPTVDDLPELPAAWVTELDAGDVADRAGKAEVTNDEVAALIEGYIGELCPYVTRLTTEAATRLSSNASRHDVARDYVARIVRAGEQGHRGAAAGLGVLRSEWLASLSRGKARDPDHGEWGRMVVGAVAIVTKAPTYAMDVGCCPLDPPTEAPAAPDGLEPPQVVTEPERDAAAEYAAAMVQAVEVEAYKLRVRSAAKIKVDAEAAAAVVVPIFDADLLAGVLARPAEPASRIDGLIPSEAGTLVVAQRKTGKTTLMLNLTRSLILGGDFLGRFPVRPITGRVAFLNFEVSAGQLARWADEVGVPVDRLYLVNLRGRRNPLSHALDRALLAARLREHEVETLVVDPFGRAYSGQSQNDAGEVGAWLSDLDVFARSEVEAVDLVLAAHAGWNGERTRGASALEDWADSIITLTRDADDESVRFLRAMGRDVEVDEDRLSFDPATRLLSMTGAGSRKKVTDDRRGDELVTALIAEVSTEPGLGIAEIGNRLRGRGLTFQDRDVSKASRRAAAAGHVRLTSLGAGRKTEHHPPMSVDPVQPRPDPVQDGVPTDPVQPRPDPVQGRGPNTPSTPSIGDGVGVGGSATTHAPDGVPRKAVDLDAIRGPLCPECNHCPDVTGHGDDCSRKET